MWNAANAQVGLEYTSSCPAPAREPAIQDGRIAVGWGGDRSFIVASVVGTTNVGVEAFNSISGRREISGAQIVINPRQAMSVACLQTMMIHELGHVLGLGHSSNADDVMFPVFTPSRPTSCRAAPSAVEYQRLNALYGTEPPPSVQIATLSKAQEGSAVRLVASGSDPFGRSLNFDWSQTGGTPVTLDPSGGTLRFTAPRNPGMLTFTVTATNSYGHSATATTFVIVDESSQ